MQKLKTRKSSNYKPVAMDCVTCLLMGVCVFCGHNFGGSGVQTFTDTGAANPGRAMTVEEVDSAMQNALMHLTTISTTSSPYRRQSKLDPRFGHIGIGKRRGPKLDPYNFNFGLGKRNFLDSTDPKIDFDPKIEEPNEQNYATFNFVKQNTPILSEGTNDFSDTVSLHTMPLFRFNIPSFLSKHLQGMTNTESNNKEFLEEEKRKLQKRRQRHRLDSFLSMSGVQR